MILVRNRKKVLKSKLNQTIYKEENMKKFELTSETKINIFGKKLFRIKALISFGDVEAGETGG